MTFWVPQEIKKGGFLRCYGFWIYLLILPPLQIVIGILLSAIYISFSTLKK